MNIFNIFVVRSRVFSIIGLKIVQIVPCFCLCVTFLFLTGCASPELRALRKAYDTESGGQAPKPQIYTNPDTGKVYWKTYEGKEAGAQVFGQELDRIPLYYYDLNLVFNVRMTDGGYMVGTVVAGFNPNRYFIAQLGTEGEFTQFELYGPTLKSIRMMRQGEKSILERGGDVLYITSQGIFKASALGD